MFNWAIYTILMAICLHYTGKLPNLVVSLDAQPDFTTLRWLPQLDVISLRTDLERHLIRLSELATEEPVAAEIKGEDTWMDIDQKIESALDGKERGLTHLLPGVLKEQQKEQGCWKNGSAYTSNALHGP
jgi:hypothetical protein